jgi:hypothetical protein
MMMPRLIRVSSIENAFFIAQQEQQQSSPDTLLLTKSTKAMALNTTIPSYLIGSDVEYYDSDEEREHIMGPASKALSLREAIDSAPQKTLAKTLLEICEHNEASKELATALLAPSHAPLSPRGTKRKASPSEVIDRVCERCGSKFGEGEQITRNCRNHPGKSHHVGVNCELGPASD